MKFRGLIFLSLSLIVALTILDIILPSKLNAAASTSVFVDVAPSNPAPNENVTITLNSYANNLDSVLITWSVNGKTTLSGIGKKIFSLQSPNAGGETDVTASIFLPDGTIDKRIIIKPSVMVLLWQADDSYVPPFYRGKALPTSDSNIKVVAMPEVKNNSGMIDPGNMIYSWKKDYTNDQNSSGYGKNYYTYMSDYLDSSNTIDVTASTVDQNNSSEASINITTYQPKINFYKYDPKIGTMWEKALSDGHKIQGSEIIQAAPYFISPEDFRIPVLNFNWFVNGQQVAVPAYSENLMPLKAPTGVSGTSRVMLEIDSSDKIFETATKEITVNF